MQRKFTGSLCTGSGATVGQSRSAANLAIGSPMAGAGAGKGAAAYLATAPTQGSGTGAGSAGLAGTRPPGVRRQARLIQASSGVGPAPVGLANLRVANAPPNAAEQSESTQNVSTQYQLRMQHAAPNSSTQNNGITGKRR